MYEHLMTTYCSIMQIDQETGDNIEITRSLRCSDVFPYIFRQARAETAYDFIPAQIVTRVAKNRISENMRLVFKTGEDFRIHSVNKWPLTSPQFLEIVLQGDGNA